MKRNAQSVGIYRLFKLGRVAGNKFDAKHKDLETDLHPIHHDYADKINEDSAINGLLYEFDEEATKKYWNGEPYKDAPKVEKAKAKKTEEGGSGKGKDENTEKGKGKATEGGDGKPEVKKFDTPEEKEAEIERLRIVYKDLSGEDALPIWGIKKLTDQIGIETEKAKAKK